MPQNLSFQNEIGQAVNLGITTNGEVGTATEIKMMMIVDGNARPMSEWSLLEAAMIWRALGKELAPFIRKKRRSYAGDRA